jgi:type III secretory pathway component EscS
VQQFGRNRNKKVSSVDQVVSLDQSTTSLRTQTMFNMAKLFCIVCVEAYSKKLGTLGDIALAAAALQKFMVQ